MEAKQDVESKMLKRAEINIHGKLKRDLLTQIPHYLVPGYNLNRKHQSDCYNVKIIKDMYKEFPYSCDYPKPLLPAAPLSRLVLSGEDPALQLLVTKAQIQDDINRITEYYNKHSSGINIPLKKDLSWKTKGTINSCTVPRCVAEVAEIIEADPDPYFSGTYNWYYTGGTLKHLVLNDYNVLLFPFTSELVATPVVPKKESIWKPKLKNASKCSLDGTLYDLRHTMLNDICFLMGRYKNHCKFYRLTGVKDKLELIEIHKQTSNIPYVSADLDPTDSNAYCVANAERSVAVWDLVKMKPTMKGVIPHTKALEDNWASIKYQKSDINILVYTDRCCVHYLDKRLPINNPVLTLCPKDVLEMCEDISLCTASRNEYCHYVGTYHSLLLLDNRSQDCIQQKWTHQFKSAPLTADVCNKYEKEIIVISSQLSGENAVVLNTWTSEDHAESFILPYRPPSILETLSMCQSMGKCLDPLLRNRLQLCNTGCCLIPGSNDGNVFLFLQNSIGDVFYQGITYEGTLSKCSMENCKAYHALESWEESILARQNTIKPLVLSDKADMEHIYNHLTNTKLKWEHKEQEFFGIPRWKQPLDKLNSYVDILAPELLSMWEVSEDPEVPLSAAPHQKVLNWLGTTEVGPDIVAPSQSPILSQEMLLTPINSQELVSASQEPNIYYSQDIESIHHQPDMSKFKSKAKQNQNKRKRSQIVAGF